MNPCLIKEIIDKNNEIKDKELIIQGYFNPNDLEKISNYCNILSSYSDIVKIYLEGNNEYYSLNECYKTLLKVREIGDQIKNLNLSPMETIMYTYDIVRNRVYTHEEEDENYSKSRSLSEIIFGDKIVCLGYSNLFRTLKFLFAFDGVLPFLRRTPLSLT